MDEQTGYDWDGYFDAFPAVTQRVREAEVLRVIQDKYPVSPYYFLAALASACRDDNVASPIGAAIGAVKAGSVAPSMVKRVKFTLHPPEPTKRRTQDEIDQEGTVNLGLWKETVDEVKAMVDIKRQLDCSYAEALRIVRDNQGGEPYPEGDGDPF